ncbi:MAG TPA: hypothetical protein VHM88_07750 [Candidatus Acidoferrales bacterium]|nr:hypothetical protein [Candidatus Acidoferrales bacterium]
MGRKRPAARALMRKRGGHGPRELTRIPGGFRSTLVVRLSFFAGLDLACGGVLRNGQIPADIGARELNSRVCARWMNRG